MPRLGPMRASANVYGPRTDTAPSAARKRETDFPDNPNFLISVAAPDGRPAVGGYPAPHKGVVAKPMPKPAPQVAHHRAPFRHAAPRTTLAAADAVGYAQSICPATPCHRHHRHECHDCHYDDNGWVELGAGIIGGIIGALIAG